MSTAGRVEIDFDHHSKDYADRWREISDENIAKCPVAHTSAHGGFWLLSDYDKVSSAARDDATFSSYHDVTGDTNDYEGIVIPPSPILQVPIELDPPEFTDYRRLLNPLFSPAVAAALESEVRKLAAEAMDRFCESGHGDLVNDFGSPVPSVITMKMLGLPAEDGERYADAIHKVTYMTPDADGYSDVLQDFFELLTELAELIVVRRAEPQDDIISKLTQAEINGALLDDEQISSVCTLVIAGGVDTTTSLFAETLVWLEQNPDAKRRLIDEPELMPQAIEEFLRFFTPQQMLARTATCDVVIGDAEIKEGERVMLSWAAANRDPEIFEDPQELILDRSPNRHTTFGLGAHRCLGSNLARMQLRVLLNEVLTRIPDYAVDHETAKPYPSIGVVNGWIALPSTFTPSPRTGSTTES